MTGVMEGPTATWTSLLDPEPDPARMHRFDAETAALAERVFAYVRARLDGEGPALGDLPAPDLLDAALGRAITPDGLGAARAFDLFAGTVAPARTPVDHPREFAFMPHAPTPAATLADIALSASAIFADWWLDGAGAIQAENQALRWLADLAGLPPGAGGVFLSGGTVANLTALHVARHAWRARTGATGRGAIAATQEAHASIRLAARVLDVDLVPVAADERGRLTGYALKRALAATDADVFAVVATAGTTNAGAVDDLPRVAAVCAEKSLWLHVDAAYGGAALASPRARPRFAGIECADSLTIDPHKWLFAPVDCSALLYRDPALARAANTQSAAYMALVDGAADWNPADYGIHLTRRARGVPLWFALATHGTDAFAAAIEASLDLALAVARAIERTPWLELLREPDLSVVLFRRRGWDAARYEAWSRWLLESGTGHVVPTTWRGKPALRFCFINPRTTLDDVQFVLDTLDPGILRR